MRYSRMGGIFEGDYEMLASVKLADTHYIPAKMGPVLYLDPTKYQAQRTRKK